MRRRQINGGADPVAKFEMPSQEIGVKVGQEHVLNVQVVFLGEGKVSVDITLRVDATAATREDSSPIR